MKLSIGCWLHLLNMSTMIGFVVSYSSSISRRALSTASPSFLQHSHDRSSTSQSQYRCYSSLVNINRQQPTLTRGRSINPSSTQLKLFFSSNNDNEEPLSTTNSNSNSDTQPQQPLLLDPTAPLRPLLSQNSHENHLSQYTLPPTTIGRDDYQPTLPKGTRIVSFGDVHGDISALRTFLITANILDPNSSNDEPIWCGGETICVQTGDVLDRGDDELACFRLLATLARQAEKAGGQLLLLYGNHESLNAAGLFQYANPGGNVEFERTIGSRIDYNYGSNRWRLQFAGNEPSRWASFEPGGLLAENMLGNMLVSCVVGRTVFVHAGLVSGHLRGGNGVDEESGERVFGGVSRLNRQAREWITTCEYI